MASKDKELAAAARAKKPKAATARSPETALPDAKARVQQGAAADLQGNVGNSGVKDLIDAQALEKEAVKADPKLAKSKESEVEDIDEELEFGAEIEEIARASDLAMGDGERVTLVGMYMPRPEGGGAQMLGHVSIVVGGVEVKLGTDTRSMSEILRHSGDTVAITGTLDLRTSGPIDPRQLEKPILTNFSSPKRR